MLGIGPAEAFIILVAALILLGPEKLPELARGIGKFMRDFRRQTDDVRGMVEREFYKMDEQLRLEDPPKPLPLPFQDPGSLLPEPLPPHHDTVPHEGLEPPPLLMEPPIPAFPPSASATSADTLEPPPSPSAPLPTLKPPEGTVSRQPQRTPAEPPIPHPEPLAAEAPAPQAAVKPGDS